MWYCDFFFIYKISGNLLPVTVRCLLTLVSLLILLNIVTVVWNLLIVEVGVGGRGGFFFFLLFVSFF